MSPRILAALFFVTLVAPAISQSGGGTLLIAVKGTQSLALVDPSSAKVTATVPEGGITGHEVVSSADGRLAFVPIYGNSGVGKPGTDGRNIAVIDIASQKMVGSIDFDHGVRPHCPRIGPKDGLLYVTTELDHSITVIAPKTLKIVGSIPTGQPESHMLILAHDNRHGYTANVGPGTVSVLDLQARRTLAIIPVSSNIQRIAISNDDKLIFTADQTTPRLAVIDAASNQVKTWIELPSVGYGSAPTVDGKWLLIALPDAGQVGVIDLKTLKLSSTIDVPAYPQEVLVRPDGKAAYVSCSKSDSVAEIDLATRKVKRVIPAGKLADGLAWAQ